jgi:hypothetical protein
MPAAQTIPYISIDSIGRGLYNEIKVGYEGISPKRAFRILWIAIRSRSGQAVQNPDDQKTGLSQSTGQGKSAPANFQVHLLTRQPGDPHCFFPGGKPGEIDSTYRCCFRILCFSRLKGPFSPFGPVWKMGKTPGFKPIAA